MYMKKQIANNGKIEIDELLPLINLSIKGDKMAVEQLAQHIYGYIKRRTTVISGSAEQAADLTQDVLMKIIRGLPKLKSARAFIAWTEKIIHNECYNQFRKKPFPLNSHIPIEPEDSAYSTDPDQFDRLTRNEMIKILSSSMKKLAPKEQTAFYLREYEGLSSNDVGKAMGIKPSTARVLYMRAGVKISKMLEAYKNGGAL
jgi:RNA polymerase sigma-70 factor (ECF subfamily)